MKFGICVAARISNIELIEVAEEVGFDSAWVADSQMIWSDCYATLAVAAERTKRINLGTGVAIAGTRIAPVTAAAIATINQLAPGRAFLGLGTGHTAMRIMGQNSMPQREFQSYAQTVRDLLDGKHTLYEYDGSRKDIALIHPGMGYYELEPRIPMHIAAAGPVGQRFAGRLGDGMVLMGVPNPASAATALENARAGAARIGGALPAGFEVTTLTSGTVLAPGEDCSAEHVIEDVGPLVTSGLHYQWEVVPEPKRDAPMPPHYAPVWLRYLDFVDQMVTPAEYRYQQVHLGHCGFIAPGERQFVTKELVERGTLTGTPDQIVERLRAAEAGGLTQVMIMSDEKHAVRVIRNFAENVFPLLPERRDLQLRTGSRSF
jgi:alkanesulfonate monooxygenase SsuD/methylene tetrahydromethanopterin reductase-like flavin-dependent oxidoreductase (luciferase family)